MNMKNPLTSTDIRDIVHDRTLVLRILVRSIETYIRDQIAALKNGNRFISSSSSESQKEDFDEYLNLDGILCHPAPLSSKSPTLWTFECNGASYPARLVNLPCPVELYKTKDHIIYYKSVDIAQMLVVYSNNSEMEKVESSQGYSNESYPSYYPHGLTPPMYKVVERRFCNRQHDRHKNVPTPLVVRDVEGLMLSIVNKLYKSGSVDPNFCKKGSLNGILTIPGDVNHKLAQEIEDEIVEYEPWMDDYGRTPRGITFSENDDICWKHPEIWLNHNELKKVKFCKVPIGTYLNDDKVMREKINLKKEIKKLEIEDIVIKLKNDDKNSINNKKTVVLDSIVSCISSREAVNIDGMKDNMDHVFLNDELQMEDQILKEGFGFDFGGDGDEGLGILL